MRIGLDIEPDAPPCPGPTPPTELSAELITIDADTGHLVSGVDVSAPDPVAITTTRTP